MDVASALVSAGADTAALARVAKRSGADSRETQSFLLLRAARMGVIIEGRTANGSRPPLSACC